MQAMKGQPRLWRVGDGTRPDGPYVALAPGSEVPLLTVDLPDGLKGLARDRVGRRVLAEALSAPLDGLEVWPWRQRRRPWTRALVGDAADLARWREMATGDCRGMVPDYLSLPCIRGVWTVAAGEEDVGARLGLDDGFTAEPELAAALLAAAEPPQAVLRLGAPCGPVDEVIAARDVPVFDDAAALQAAGHGEVLAWAEAVQGLDLLAPPSAAFDRIRNGLRRWAVPAAVAAAAAAVWVAALLIDTGRLDARAAAARAATEAMVRAHFVPSGPILDVRAQVARAIESAAPPPAPAADPLILFQTAAPVLAEGTLAVRAVSFDAASGLVAAVEVTDFAALEALAAALRAAGFAVEDLDSGARQDGGVAARLRLTGGEG